jgi:hypothetical protein
MICKARAGFLNSLQYCQLLQYNVEAQAMKSARLKE